MMIHNYPRTMYADSDASGAQDYVSLRLYVTGRTEKSLAARSNLRRVCETHLAGRYDLEVVDLAEEPKRAADDRILATPTLVRRAPGSARRIVGDLSNTEKLLARLDIRKTTGFA
jgi:circadian clock protein KaiB